MDTSERKGEQMSDKRDSIHRALIGTDQRGIPIVLATDSDWISFDCEVISTGVEDIGLGGPEDFPEPGLYLFEGRAENVIGGTWDGPPEPETVYTGTIRKVGPEEVAELYRMYSCR